MAVFRPDEFFSCVEAISAKELVARGFRTVLLDIDNTLVPRDSHEIPPSVVAWVGSLKAEGLRACLVSNNWHRVIFDYAHTLDVPLVYKAMKPAAFAFTKALRLINSKLGSDELNSKQALRQEKRCTVMIGDQLFTDVAGAHLAGIHAILVQPQAPQDLWYTLILRKLERFLIGNMQPLR
jgi:HAD superfamily phosphatase (TIGR01668 family)